MVKGCDLGLGSAARGRRPRAVFSGPRSQFFTQPANNIYIYIYHNRRQFYFELHDKFKFIGTLNRFCDHLNYHHMEVIITNVIFLLIFVALGYRTFDVFSSSMRLLISL